MRAISDRKETPKKAMNFYDSIKPAYIVSRIFGFLPFAVEHDSYGKTLKASVGIFDMLWFFGAITLDLGFVYFIMTYSLKQMFKIDSPVLLEGCRAIAGLGLILTVLAIVLDMINRKRIIQILGDFVAFDEQVNKQ